MHNHSDRQRLDMKNSTPNPTQNHICQRRQTKQEDDNVSGGKKILCREKCEGLRTKGSVREGCSELLCMLEHHWLSSSFIQCLENHITQ